MMLLISFYLPCLKPIQAILDCKAPSETQSMFSEELYTMRGILNMSLENALSPSSFPTRDT